MRDHLLVILGIFFCLTGCGLKAVPVTASYEAGDNIHNREVQTASIGDKMLYQYSRLRIPALLTESQITLPDQLALKIPTIPTSTKCVKVFIQEGGLFVCSPTPVIYNMGGLVPYPICLLTDSNDYLVGVTSCGLPDGKFNSESYDGIKLKKTDEYAKPSTTKEIIYNGKTANNIKMLYREYVDDYARPAFFQDLVYDLGESKTIGFKGLKIEVTKATNSEITFRVLSGDTL